MPAKSKSKLVPIGPDDNLRWKCEVRCNDKFLMRDGSVVTVIDSCDNGYTFHGMISRVCQLDIKGNFRFAWLTQNATAKILS
jgi:hypothetical protein